MHKKVLISLIALLLACAANATPKKCVDANGAITYTEAACPSSLPSPNLASSATPSEIQMRAAVTSAVARAFAERDYQWLEQTANDYRTSKARTPSGLWKLSLFHVAIGEAMSRSTNRNPNNYGNVDSFVSEWVAKYPNSPVAHIVQSQALFSRAGAYRGNGMANTVAPEAWKPFYEFVALAKANLERSKSIASVNPTWYELMLMIGTAEGWEKTEFQKTFDEAIKCEPAFYQTYFAALDYLLPKWGGSAAEVEKFALSAAQKTSATEGKGMYARIYWYASQSQYSTALFTNSMAQWPMMRDGFDDVIAKYPEAWNVNNFAKFACMAKDQVKTKQLFDQIGPDLVPQAWGNKGLLGYCQGFAARS